MCLLRNMRLKIHVYGIFMYYEYVVGYVIMQSAKYQGATGHFPMQFNLMAAQNTPVGQSVQA